MALSEVQYLTLAAMSYGLGQEEVLRITNNPGRLDELILSFSNQARPHVKYLQIIQRYLKISGLRAWHIGHVYGSLYGDGNMIPPEYSRERDYSLGIHWNFLNDSVLQITVQQAATFTQKQTCLVHNLNADGDSVPLLLANIRDSDIYCLQWVAKLRERDVCYRVKDEKNSVVHRVLAQD